MKPPHVPSRPAVLSIAGSDASAGAGIQADLKAIEACGGYAATALTAVTAQNTQGVRRAFPLPADLVRDQLEAVLDDLPVAALKTGMLAEAAIVRVVADVIAARGRGLPFVLDPVMVAKSGDRLLAPAAIEALVERLLPLATVVTPNVHETEALTGSGVASMADAERAGRRLLDRGAAAALIKGGHLRGAPGSDLLVTLDGLRWFHGPWIETEHTHGTGCTYASAIATWLARGLALEAAIARAKAFVTEAIRHGGPIGRGHGPTDPLHALRGGAAWTRRDRDAGVGRLHVITDEVRHGRHSHEELGRLAFAGGADVVQLRDKRARATSALVHTAGVLLGQARAHGGRVVVDDRADVAWAAGADGVHLGALDLDPASARRLLGGEALVGATAHTVEEAHALRTAPVDYLGVGPVFPTDSKDDSRPALGLAELGRIVAVAAQPVIAIGGVTAEQVPALLAAGAHGVAVLAAVCGAADPQAATARLRLALDGALARSRA